MKRKKNASNGIIGGETVTTALDALFVGVPHFLKYCLYDTTGKAFFSVGPRRLMRSEDLPGLWTLIFVKPKVELTLRFPKAPPGEPTLPMGIEPLDALSHHVRLVDKSIPGY